MSGGGCQYCYADVGDKPKDNWQNEDAITSVMAQTQNVQNMLVRATQLDRIKGFHDD
jgi:hypothetical protein